MRRLLACIGALWGLTALLIGASLISRIATAPSNSVLTPTDCSQPCWNGIQPGQTTLQEVVQRLSADPTVRITSSQTTLVCWDTSIGQFARGCAYSWRGLGVDDDRIQVLDLFPGSRAFMLGDALLSFGAPVAYQPYCGAANGNVYFEDSVITVLPVGGVRLSPMQPIVYVSYVSTATTWYSTFTPLWRGFRSLPTKRLC